MTMLLDLSARLGALNLQPWVGLGRRFRILGSMRPLRWLTLHWAISVNNRPQSFVADRPRATHSVHSCTVCLKLRPDTQRPWAYPSAVGQPGRFHADDADGFVLVSGASARPHRADDLARRILDDHRAGLRQELALCRGCQ